MSACNELFKLERKLRIKVAGYFSLLLLPEWVQEALPLPLVLLLHVIVGSLLIRLHVGALVAEACLRPCILLHVLVVRIRIVHIPVHFCGEIV